MAVIGAITVNITAATDKLTKGLRSASTAVSRFARSTQGMLSGLAFAAAGASVTALVKQQLDLMDATAKTADKLGIATEKLQGLRHAAKLAGITTQTLDTALQRMVRRISEASLGKGEALGALTELQLDPAKLAAMSPEQQLGAIADAMQRTATAGDRVRLAMRLFDTEGVALVNMLRGGSEGLADMQAEAEKLGIAFNRVDAAKVEIANDAVTRMREAFAGVTSTVAVEVAPVMTLLAQQVQAFGESLKSSVDQSVPGIGGLTKALGLVADMLETIRLAWLAFDAGWRTLLASLAHKVDDLVQGIVGALNKIPGIEIEQPRLQGDVAGAHKAQKTFWDAWLELPPSQRIAEQAMKIEEQAAAAAEKATAKTTTVNPMVARISRNIGQMFAQLTGAASTAAGGALSSAIGAIDTTHKEQQRAPLEALDANTIEGFIARRENLNKTSKTAEQQLDVQKNLLAETKKVVGGIDKLVNSWVAPIVKHIPGV